MLTAPTFSTSRSQIAGLDIADLAKKFGTPLYVYDRRVIDQRIADLQAFDVVRFAQKACSNLAILDRVRKQGVVVDAVSAGEVRRAIAAGFSTDPQKHEIVYTLSLIHI